MTRDPELLTVSEHSKKCSMMKWGLGLTITGVAGLIVLVCLSVNSSFKAFADTATATEKADTVKAALETHERVQAVQFEQISRDIAEIKVDLKDIRGKLK